MKKRLLSLAALACLVLSLAACGGGDTQESPASDTPAQASTPAQAETTPAQEEDSSGLSSLEDYMNSDTMQAMVAATAEQYEEQGISAAMYAVGDELHYDFTIQESTTEEDRDYYAQALESSLEAASDTFVNNASAVAAAVSNDVVVVVVTYLDADGNVLYTQSYSSADAE